MQLKPRSMLSPAQISAIDFTKETPRCAIIVGVGFGKTVTALTALSDLIQMGAVRRCLVVSTNKIVTHTWPDELKNWLHLSHLTYTNLAGKSIAERNAILKHDQSCIHGISFGLLDWLAKKHFGVLGKGQTGFTPYDMIIIDESSAAKNNKTLRHKNMLRLGIMANRILLMTATPCANSLENLYNQIYILDGGARLGVNLTTFRERYGVKINQSFNRYSYSAEALNAALSRITDICMAPVNLVKKPHTNHIVPVYLAEKDLKIYTQILEKAVYAISPSAIVSAKQASTKQIKLRQVATGGIRDNTGKINYINTQKLDVLVETVNDIREQGVNNIIIGYNFKSDLYQIKSRFKEAKHLDETTPDAWNQKEVPILLMHPQSAGHGLNLQYGGSTIIWFSLPLSYEDYEQLNGRICRQGQAEMVDIIHLIVQNSIEETLLSRYETKRRVQEMAISLLRESTDAWVSRRYNGGEPKDSWGERPIVQTYAAPIKTVNPNPLVGFNQPTSNSLALPSNLLFNQRAGGLRSAGRELNRTDVKDSVPKLPARPANLLRRLA